MVRRGLFVGFKNGKLKILNIYLLPASILKTSSNLLSLITLGIYSFWMAVKIQKYCIENTIIIDDEDHNNEINKVNTRQLEYENSVKKPLNLIILSFGFILSGFSILAVFIGGMYLFILGFVAGVALLYYGFSKKSSK